MLIAASSPLCIRSRACFQLRTVLGSIPRMVSDSEYTVARSSWDQARFTLLRCSIASVEVMPRPPLWKTLFTWYTQITLLSSLTKTPHCTLCLYRTGLGRTSRLARGGYHLAGHNPSRPFLLQDFE